MPRKSTATPTKAKKSFVIAERIGTFLLETVTIRNNSKVSEKHPDGTPYIPVNLEGYDKPVAVYMNIEAIEPCTVYTLVQFEPSKKGETGAYALNKPTARETLQFWANEKKAFPELSIGEIKEAYGVE